MPELVDLYAIASRMRVLNMPQPAFCADIDMRTIMETYFEPNRIMADVRGLVKTDIDPLKDFSEAAREELRAFASL